MISENKLKILLVDDHDELRNEMASLIEKEENLRVVGHAVDGEEAIRRFSDLSPDLVVMDIVMPGINGIDASRSILARNPKARVLALSNHVGHNLVHTAIEAGITGYVCKTRAFEELIQAINSVASGERFLGKGVDE